MKSYFDITGDGGSNILAQVVQQQSRIDAALAPIRHRVAVASGKGGVGKSTLTFQIACALRAQGMQVAIMDADLNGPSQAHLAGLRNATILPGADGRMMLPRSANGIGVFSLGSLLRDSDTLDFESEAHGSSFTWRATREFTLMGEILASVDWTGFDVLLFDLPPGTERTLQYAEFLGPSTAFVLVTVPSDLSRSVVARSVTALQRNRTWVLGCIENMSGYYCRGCDAVKPLFPALPDADVGVLKLGAVPFDPEIASCADGSRVADAAARPVGAITARLLELLAAPPLNTAASASPSGGSEDSMETSL